MNPSIFEFTEEDLKINKRGQLSAHQREWLQSVAAGIRKFSWKSAILMIVFAVIGLCIILALYLQNEGARAALFSNPMNLVMLPAILILVLGIAALVIFLNDRHANKLTNTVLSSATGGFALMRIPRGKAD